MSDKKKAFWFVALLSTLVLLPFIGESLFYSKGEPREAIVAFSMLESGNWILPVNYGTDIAYKPPFLYWMIAAVSALNGAVTEFTARFPSVVTFLLMQMVFFCFVARYKGTRVAILTAMLLLTSFEVHRAAVACRVDMVQVSFIVISLCLLFRWDEKGCRGVPWLAVLLMGFATLTKGPVGFLLPCGCIGLYQLIRGRAFWKAFLSLAGIGLLSFSIYMAWAVAAYLQGGEAFYDLMIEENIDRFMGKMSYESHENPVWYNFLTITWGWVPWTLVLLISLFGLKWKEMRLLPEGNGWGDRLKKGWEKFRNQSPVQLFIWVVILLIFVFYCIPKSKRSVYLLPIYPFMAVLIAEYLLMLARRMEKTLRICAIVFATLCLLLTAVFIVVRMGWLPEAVWGTGRHAAENIAFATALEVTPLSFGKLFLVSLPFIAACCFFYALRRKANGFELLHLTVCSMLAIYLSLDSFYQPTVLNVKSDKKLAERVCEYVPEGSVYSYLLPRNFYCANFYLNDRMRHIEKEFPAEGFILVAEGSEEAMLQEYAAIYSFERIFRTDERSCDMRDEVCLYRFKKK